MTESITKTTFTETTVKRVTSTAVVEQVALRRSGGPLGLSIIGGNDHSCVPFGTGQQVLACSPLLMVTFVYFSKLEMKDLPLDRLFLLFSKKINVKIKLQTVATANSVNFINSPMNGERKRSINL